MTRQKPKTYPAKIDGRTIRVTVPGPDEGQDLFDAIRDHLSPGAVAAIAAHLQAASTKDEQVNGEIRWLAEGLVKLLGTAEYGRLLDEVGC
jgi:hypothetical protein